MQNDRIDIHAHILPGVDDGARTMEEAVELAVMAAEQGIQTVIATPHYSRQGRQNDYGIIAEETEREIKKKIPEFTIFLGQELYYHEELEDRLLSGQALSLAGTEYILVEFDVNISYTQLKRAVRSLSGSGYIPILAHVERYACLRKEGLLEEIHRLGALFQMNYESLDGRWYDREVRWCRKQIKDRYIDFLSTDMHRTDYRAPAIKGALSWLESHIDEGYAAELVRKNAMKILRAVKEKNR